MKRLLLAFLILVTTIVAAPSIAMASCIGPTISYPGGEVEAGAQVLVEGMGWGDNCYDTGPPPEGEGVLGTPRSGIEVFIVQDGVETLVGTGDADAEYNFEVTITIPSDLTSGKINIVAREGGFDGFVEESKPLMFVESDTVVEAVVADFEPSDAVLQTFDDPFSESSDETGNNWLLYTIGAAVLVLAALGASIAYARRSS